MHQRFRSLKTLGRIPAGWWVLLSTLPALVPLLRPGFFESHDGLFHAFRLAALDNAVRAGVLYPRWFPEFAFGYGHPVLNFYGPLSYYWGLPFTLAGLDPALALKLVLAIGLVASALALYLFARLHLDRGPAFVAAVVYVYLPYHLADLYVRGALAEFLFFVWAPLVLWAFHRLAEPSAWHGAARVALAALLLTALIATHSLSALIFAPVLAAYIVLLLVRGRSRRLSLRIGSALALALCLSAFYWLPILTESGFVGLGTGASQGYRDHLLPLAGLVSLAGAYPYPGQGVAPTFPLGLIQVAILAVSVAMLFRRSFRQWPAPFFLAVGLCSAYMLTVPSLPVWRAFEKGLALLQYPWRFQALTVLATAYLAGALTQSLARSASLGRLALGAGLVLATCLTALWRLPVQAANPELSVEEMWRRDREAGQVGATWTGEFLPIWVKEQRWALSRPPAEGASDEGRVPAGQVSLLDVAYTRYGLAVEAPEETRVILHQFYYPGWQARWEGVSYASSPEGLLGLAAFDVPAGKAPLSLRLGLTGSQWAGNLASLLACLACTSLLLVRLGPAARARSWEPLLPIVCLLLLGVVLLASIAFPNGRRQKANQVQANLENAVELLAFTTDRPSYRAGDVVSVTLYWRALRDLGEDYKAFVHLTDPPATQPIAQHDGDPGGGFTPTTRWLAGELVPDAHPIPLPADLPVGRYLLWAGMYEQDGVRNLEVVSGAVPSRDNRVLLGEVTVEAP